jgi:hypothetical protein
MTDQERSEIFREVDMTEQERDKMLHDAEVMFMKRKVDCKSEKTQRAYGTAINSIHKDRCYHVKDIFSFGAHLSTCGRCVCGNIVSFTDNTHYCSRCGQRLSTNFGWTASDYYNEKGENDESD